jgi:DNA topoisomerase-1
MPSGITCPKDGGELVKIGSAKGRKPFWGCENFRAEGDAKCDYKLYTAPIKEACPKCGATFLTHAGGKKNPVIKCVKDRCDYSRPADAPTGDDDDAGDEGEKKKPGARKTAKPAAHDDASA